MKRINSFQYFAIFSYLATFVNCESYYSIIAPGTLKSNRKFNVAVTLHNANEPSMIRVTVEGPSFQESKDVFVNPLELKLIDFIPQKLSDGVYKLKAEGISGLSFKNESILLIEPDYGPHIYIQTDKAIYKPSDLVQFRVVILDEHTRPLNVKEPIRIEILDNLDNRVKQFKDVSLIKGVYNGQFQLSEYPVLGLWKIKVIITGKYAHSKAKNITVQKYVLPKFSVHLKTPGNILRANTILKVGLYGKYTYDKYVAGQAIIELMDPMKDILLQRKQIEIETLGFVEFHLDEIKEYENVESIKIQATFVENLTGITQSITRYIGIKSQSYIIEIPTEDIEFRNNKPYRLKAHVKHYTGAAVVENKTPVVMKHGGRKYESYLDSKGVATFEFEHNALSDHVFEFYDSEQKFPNIMINENLDLNSNGHYCRLKLIGGRPRLGRNLEIEVSSIEDIPYFVYSMMGHGGIIHMELVKVPAKQKSFIIRLKPSIEMVPICFVYVHYIHDGNLRYEELELKFPQELENQISLRAPKDVGPGKEVTIDILAEPNSYVSILAVDLSVYLLDSSYDLKKNDLLFDLSADRSYKHMAFSLQPGTVSGLITLTNAHYYLASNNADRTYIHDKLIPPTFRNRFPETWIFQNLEIQNNNTQLTLQIPDTITTWRITAFSNNDIKGFGIVNEPTDITTILPFFITLNLPYSVKRGEIVAITILVFNYLHESLDTEVIFYNENQKFYFMESNRQEAEKSKDYKKQIKHINAPSDGAKTVIFYISPIQLGEISLKISASNHQYSDALIRKLKVEPEGVRKLHNKAMYLSATPNEAFSSFFYLVFPDELIPDSEYITLSVGSDYIVPTLENFDDLINLPTGCGEQNMIHFAPNILILHYLKVNGKLGKEKDLVKKIRSYIDIGYQQQLSFRHANGGYSVFGESSDSEPSNWLTAYVVRFFIKSAKYSPVEIRIIEADLEYLAKQQMSNGEFPHSGYLFSPTHQNKYGFTAFVLLTFLEDRKYALKYQTIIQEGIQYLTSNVDNIKDIYALSIVGYALTMAQNNKAHLVIDKIKQQSQISNGLMWWSSEGARNTANDEITGYALMALLTTPGDHTPILKWLIQQRNAKGGFKSTQDTVVGLQALVKFSENQKTLNNINMTIKYRAQDQEGIELDHNEFKMDSDNALILQQHDLPKSTRHISFEVTGTGNSLIQVSYQYNMVENEQYHYFHIEPKVKQINSKEIDLEVCFTYQTSSDLSNNRTNMVIMEINLPSGCRSNADYDIDDNELVQRVEMKNSDSTIILYFDTLSANIRNCLNFAVDVISDVIKTKPAAIIMYDYYNLSRSDTKFYNFYYSVIAPGILKSNRKYPVAVTLHNADEPSTIRVTIEGPSFHDTKDVFVQPLELKLIEFIPQKLSDGDYKLKVEGISGLSFKNESDLLVAPSYGPRIYIQTDKAIYKPNDLVQFRTVILDEHTRPLKIKEPIRIEILDDLDNRVKQLKNVVLTKGVYTGQFQLSEYPVLGVWKIKVIISGKYGHTQIKTIYVRKYILPKFSVHLNSPSNILRENTILKVGLYGKYTYDKYVAGQAIIELMDPMKDILLQRKQIEIETVGFVEFHLDQINEIKNLEMLKINARLVEDLTGITQSESRNIFVKNQKYKITIPIEDIEFRNNKPYRLKAHVKHYTGAAVVDNKTPVLMKHGGREYESHLDTNGVAIFEFDHNDVADHVFEFKDFQKKFPNMMSNQYLKSNQNEYYCRLKLIGGRPRLGRNLEIEISSIENIPYFVYSVMGHGGIIRMELVKVPGQQKTFKIHLTPTIEMVPISFLYVHYIHNGNLRYEELELKFPQELENQISVKALKEMRPGKEVTIDIQAEPNSYVSILAVDLSVYLLDSSYDLKKYDIFFGLTNDRSYIPIATPLYPGVISGLITLTNSHYYLPKSKPDDGYKFPSAPKDAFSFPSSSKPDGTYDLPPHVRTKFPETWIFQNLEIQNNNTQLTLQIPDTITTWRITAFSNNDIKGFGIVNEPTDITTILPFFITLNLPYSVKRGEIVAITILVFNYLDQSLETEVIFYNENQEFYFMDSNHHGEDKSQEHQKQIKYVNVPSDEAKTVIFYINPIQLGEISLKISASNSQYSDALIRKLKVESEGVRKLHNKAMYLSANSNASIVSSFSLDFPGELIPDSEYITLSVGGDYIVPTLENFDDLINLPTGCGEQNMIHFAPNILILHYLKVNGKLGKEKDLIKKIRSYIDIGYQQQLSFRHANGGYSVFGESSDSEPSNWLTAYVVRFFIKSAKYSPVEIRIIEADLEYLAKQQMSNGEFPHSGYLFSPTHQNKYGFTAFVLLTFLEDRKYALKYQTIIQEGIQYLTSNVDNIKDIYALSIVGYALTMAQNNKAHLVIDKIKQQSQISNGLMWWSSEGARNAANDVEITSYALMALLTTPGDHTPILKWLIQQRNAKGGFKSTQDTVVGLQALVKFSENQKTLNNINMTIKYRAQDREGIDSDHNEFKMDSDNALILQQHDLSKSTRNVSFEVTGTGNSLIQVSYQYSMIGKEQYRYFHIQPNAKHINSKEMDLEVCFTYQTPAELSNTTTNMVIMEINLPSGCRSNLESNYGIENNELVQKIEMKNSDSTIILYFENLLSNIKNCLNFAVDIISDVIKTKPAAIIVYDYYNLSRSDTAFYNIQE
ncbi:uncharacterized protein ACRADG_004064 [Cochliomyia hominivorax]